MHLAHLLFDRDLLRAVCTDLAADVAVLATKKQVRLWGDEPAGTQVDCDAISSALGKLLRDDTPLWELQWVALVLIYISDTFVAALTEGTYASVMVPFFHGHATMPSYEDRFVAMVFGKFGEKSAKGARKKVLVDAKNPMEAVVACVMDVHRLMQMGNAP